MTRISATPPNNKSYGSFYDTTTQTAASANVAYPITINTTDFANGITVNASSITFLNAGIYNIQFSAQIADIKTANFDIWIKKNGSNVLGSDGTVSVSNQNQYALPAWNYLLNLNSNDVIQFFWASTSNTASIVYAASSVPAPYHPSIASMIVTAVQI